MNPIFKGTGTALVTPFDKDGKVDYIAFARIIDFQINGGIDALIVLGTTGEASTISLDEKKRIVETAIKQAKGRIPLIVGVGGNNPNAIIEFGRWLKKKRKVSGVLISSPYYNKATQSGLVKFFSHVARQIKLPMIIYNVPGRVGMNIEPSTFQSIVKSRYVAGIKEASGNIQQVSDVIRLCPDTAVYAGDDSLCLPAYALGACGVISVASNIKPTQVGSIYKRAEASDWQGAREAFLQALPMFKNLFCEVNPIPVKYALSCMGLIENELRLPLTPLDKRYHSCMRSVLQ